VGLVEDAELAVRRVDVPELLQQHLGVRAACSTAFVA
jgi:hypothetical protein